MNDIYQVPFCLNNNVIDDLRNFTIIEERFGREGRRRAGSEPQPRIMSAHIRLGVKRRE